MFPCFIPCVWLLHSRKHSLFTEDVREIKPSLHRSRQEEDPITLCYLHYEVNTLPQWGWIEQSDVCIIQSTEQTDWQLPGPTSYTSAWKRRRAQKGERQRQKGADCQWWRWCSRRLRLWAVCCYCASVIAGGQACQDRAAFPQRPQPLCWNAGEEVQPERWMCDGSIHRWPSSGIPSERLHCPTSSMSCIIEQVQIKVNNSDVDVDKVFTPF